MMEFAANRVGGCAPWASREIEEGLKQWEGLLG